VAASPEHGRLREQGDQPVVPRISGRYRWDTDQPEQSADRRHGRRQAHWVVHGQRHRPRRCGVPPRQGRSELRRERAYRRGGRHAAERSVSGVRPLRRGVRTRFHFYSELNAKEGVITGYIKPLFEDLQVYSKEQDKDKSAVQKMYEHVVGGVAKVLKNRKREEVATKAGVVGRTDNPKVSTLGALGGIVENAFFQAVLPGFDAESARTGRAEK